MTSEQETLPPLTDVPSVPFEYSWPYIAGLIGFSIGLGFYGLLFVMLLIAWALDAPNAPTASEGAAIYRAAIVHLFPLCLWIAYRKQIAGFPIALKWTLAVGSWLLIPATVAVMVYYLGV
jgi:hypothetical protein